MPTEREIQDEEKKIRKLQSLISIATHVILQGSIPFDEAQKFLEGVRQAALTLFPDKGDVYDLIYGSRFRRLMSEVYRLP